MKNIADVASEYGISFDDLDNDDEEITERDKKDILWGLEYGAHVIGLSCANTAEHVESVKTFLEQNNAGEMKVFAKIETRSGLKNLNESVKNEIVDRIWKTYQNNY